MTNKKVLSQIRVLQEQISNMSAEQFAGKFYAKSVEDEKAQYYRFMETVVIGCESEIPNE